MNLATIVCRLCGAVAEVPERQVSKSYDRACRSCRAAYSRAWREKRRAAGIAERRNPERAAEYEKARAADPAVKRRRADAMARYARDPDLRVRHEARWKVRRAVAAGMLIRQSCGSCGAARSQAHHDDYSKPLDVRWLCASCHRAWHRSNTPIYPDARVQGVQS